MAKKEITIDAATLSENNRFAADSSPNRKATSLIGRIENLRAVRSLAAAYSSLLEETVTPRRTLKLVHAQMAAALFLLPADMPTGLRLLLIAWAALACWQCRK